MKKYLQFVLLLLMGYLAGEKAHAQQWEWATRVGGINNDFVNSVVVDDLGNSYVTGKFFDSISFGSTTLLNPGLWSVYIAKYDIHGELVWDRIVASDSLMSVSSMNIDKHGNITIAGQYKGVASFYGKTIHKDITSTGDYDIFIAKLNNVGEIIWANTLGGLGIDFAGGVSNDNNGNVYLTGDFHISPFQYSSSKIFVAKYDEAGNNSWIRMEDTFGNNHFGLGIKADDKGNSYITGQFFNTIAFDSKIIADAGTSPELTIYIAKFDSYGKNLWGQKAGAASGYCGSNAIDIDVEGNSYITGFYHGTIFFDNQSITGTSGGANDVFVAKYNSDGKYEWVSKSIGAGLAKCISIKENGNIYVSGDFSGNIMFGASSLSTTGSNDVFVTELNPSGNYIWSTSFGGKQSDNIKSIVASSNGVFLTGNFTDTIRFGNSLSLTDYSSTLSDVFVSKLSTFTGIEEETNYALLSECYPNPVENEVELRGVKEDGMYVLYNVFGKKIQEGSLKSSNKLSVGNLCAGVYFVYVTSLSNMQRIDNFKFIKK